MGVKHSGGEVECDDNFFDNLKTQTFKLHITIYMLLRVLR